jgi:hypothetical protein
MSGNQTTDGSTDEITQLVRAFAEAAFNDPGEVPVPMASTRAVDVIRSQLTENTGTHFLDSGGADGRHWQENQDNPPWERPEWNVGDGYVTHNVADWLERSVGRDRTAVALEAALFAFGHTDDQQRNGWLSSAEAFRELLLDGTLEPADLRAWGVPDAFVRDVLSVQNDIRDADHGFTFNTYNGECHSLSQVLQGVVLGGPYAEYGFVQVHQGADVRGGYTAPRAYTSKLGGWLPHELEFQCQRCEWVDYESCLYGTDELRFQRSIDPSALADEGRIEAGDDAHPALNAAYDADHVDGAVFHECDDGDIGYCVFR